MGSADLVGIGEDDAADRRFAKGFIGSVQGAEERVDPSSCRAQCRDGRDLCDNDGALVESGSCG